MIERFCRVMETAHAEYESLVMPMPDAGGRPLEVLLFARPDEWEAYTKTLTGRDAPLYLSVGQGGYAYGDRFVCWLCTETDLWSVAAHEGFHQYVARHLYWRLPPALEEGLATTFENVSVGDRTVTIDRDRNPRRAEGLAAAARAHALLPLDRLILLHAGDVAAHDLATREAFYGQCWALARVLSSDASYAAGLGRLLKTLADPLHPQPIGRANVDGIYYPAAIRPLLEQVAAGDWGRLVREYDTFKDSAAAFARE